MGNLTVIYNGEFDRFQLPHAYDKLAKQAPFTYFFNISRAEVLQKGHVWQRAKIDLKSS